MKKIILTLAIITVLISACARQTPAAPLTPTSAPAQVANLLPTATSLPPVPSPSPVPPSPAPTSTVEVTPTSEGSLFPTVTFNQNVICRLGPDPLYYKVTNFSASQTSQVQARSEDGLWLNVISNAANKSYTCWVPRAAVQPIENVTQLLVSIPPSLPTGPTWAQSSKGVCGINRSGAILVTWGPAGSGTGYYVLRNGKNIATVYGDSYIDHDTPGSKTAYVYTYVIQAFNASGLARVVASVSVTMCD